MFFLFVFFSLVSAAQPKGYDLYDEFRAAFGVSVLREPFHPIKYELTPYDPSCPRFIAYTKPSPYLRRRVMNTERVLQLAFKYNRTMIYYPYWAFTHLQDMHYMTRSYTYLYHESERPIYDEPLMLGYGELSVLEWYQMMYFSSQQPGKFNLSIISYYEHWLDFKDPSCNTLIIAIETTDDIPLQYVLDRLDVS